MIRVGIGGWVFAPWRGEFYPKGLPQARELEYASFPLGAGTLVLYDVSSTYFEGRTCELAKFGHNRDGKSGKLQIVFGLLCARDGCPVAI
jgi:hypothetical protein